MKEGIKQNWMVAVLFAFVIMVSCAFQIQIKSLQSSIENESSDNQFNMTWTKGLYNAKGILDNSALGVSCDVIYGVTKINLDNDVQAVLWLYKDGVFVGKIDDEMSLSTKAGSFHYYDGVIDLTSVFGQYDANGVKISLIPTSDSIIADAQLFGEANVSVFGNPSENKYEHYHEENTNLYSINHRGFNVLAPENTIPAFILSKKKGFKYVECDVQFTSDGIPVILHDTTINRTARNVDGTPLKSEIAIKDITYKEALDYDYGIYMGEEYRGTPIPSFSEFIQFCKLASLHPFIELKDADWWSDTQFGVIAEEIFKAGMQDDVTFISFSYNALSGIQEYFPSAQMALADPGKSEDDTLRVIGYAQSLMDNGCRECLITRDYKIATDSWFELIENSKLKAILWTVDDMEAIENIRPSVGGVLTNHLQVGTLVERKTLSNSQN